MIGRPDCSWASLRRPQLRTCPLPHSIVWREKIGYGLDGTVWKVDIDGQPYALKVRECQIAALLQTIRAAVEASPEPVCLKKEPRTWKDAVRNLYAFSDEELSSLGPKLWPTGVVLDRVKRQMSPWEEYFAIFFEFIPSQGDSTVDTT
ncbi:hypothetical protein V8C42DRAFT_343927 [Trichoderma barbatum]